MSSEPNDGFEFDLSGDSPLHEISDAEFDKHKARFMEYALICAAEMVTVAEVDELNMLDTLRAMLVYAIESGLNNLLFCPWNASQLKIVGIHPEDRAEIDKLWDDGIPWPIVCAVADAHGVDAMKVLEDHLRESFRKGAANGSLAVLSGFAVHIEGDGGEFPGTPPYMLNCVHDDHPCRHPFGDLQSAVRHAYDGMARGILQSVDNITRGDEEMMTAEVLRERLQEIGSIGSN